MQHPYPYVTIAQSIAPKQKWNWCVHEPSGHEYHIKTGFATYELAAADALLWGYKYIKELENLYGWKD